VRPLKAPTTVEDRRKVTNSGKSVTSASPQIEWGGCAIANVKLEIPINPAHMPTSSISARRMVVEFWLLRQANELGIEFELIMTPIAVTSESFTISST
jgi:hypothetical protein